MSVSVQTKSVYLSYSPRDFAQAAVVKRRLANDGLVVQDAFDTFPQLPQNYTEAVQIRETIGSSDALVVLATPAYVHATYMTMDFGIAFAQEKPIFIVLTNEVTAKDLPEFLRTNRVFTYNNLAELADAIHGALRNPKDG